MARHIHFVTGRLAAVPLRRTVEPLAEAVGFAYSIDVLPITVAALMTPEWIAGRMQVPAEATEVMVPGYCDGDLSALHAATNVPIVVGPRELRALPESFDQQASVSLDDHNVEILAEINHAPRLTLDQILQLANRYRESGADIIDLGCDPAARWHNVAETVRAVRDQGLRVSIDSLNVDEIADAVDAGAELVLSVNSTNRHAAPDWDAEVVVIPDEPGNSDSLEQTMEWCEIHGVPFRLDPILEPIGCGFGNSIARYWQTRQQYPEARIMMGIGNLTELTDVDSAGVNMLLIGFCAELQIDSVLTTEVIPWARTSVRECDVARRIAHFAVQHAVPAKRVADELVQLRDPRVYAPSLTELLELTDIIKDNNYRIFVADGRLHIISAKNHWHSDCAYDLFRQLEQSNLKNLSPSHAFYLGFELAKATTALTLDKQYTQDQALRWGHLSRDEGGQMHPGRRPSGEADTRE